MHIISYSPEIYKSIIGKYFEFSFTEGEHFGKKFEFSVKTANNPQKSQTERRKCSAPFWEKVYKISVCFRMLSPCALRAKH